MNWKQPKVYAVKHKNADVVAASRSGGFFTAVSDWVFSQQGVVYGCILDENFYAVHIRAEKEEERDRMRGSKYVQSKIGNIYKDVSKDLKDGRFVLFSGTSCQIAGLKKYLGNEYNNLLCVDIVCHGVPSPKVWNKYLQWQEKKNHSKVEKAVFRNKTDFGWRAHKETLTFENGKSISSDVFTTLFYGHSILRPCCYECPYKTVIHPGDITIADYWGIENAAPEFDDNKGVSLVLINNDTGEKVLNLIKDALLCKSTKIEDSMQNSFKAPYPRPITRDRFWTDFSTRNFDYVAKKYCGVGIFNKIMRGAIKIKRRMSQ